MGGPYSGPSDTASLVYGAFRSFEVGAAGPSFDSFGSFGGSFVGGAVTPPREISTLSIVPSCCG